MVRLNEGLLSRHPLWISHEEGTREKCIPSGYIVWPPVRIRYEPGRVYVCSGSEVDSLDIHEVPSIIILLESALYWTCPYI